MRLNFLWQTASLSCALELVAACGGPVNIGDNSKARDASPEAATDASGECCEDGLTWRGCCGTPSFAAPHPCGSTVLCQARCDDQHACGAATSPDGNVEAHAEASADTTALDVNGECCEDGLAWGGCCGTPSFPASHRCGGTVVCAADCDAPHACGTTPDGNVEAHAEASADTSAMDVNGECCEDGLAWRGCCGTPSFPGPHACGSTVLCQALCDRQHVCGATSDAASNPDARSETGSDTGGAETGGACCEDGLTWTGCCSSPSDPLPHLCGTTFACQQPCVNQHSCGG
jgi:hypothetical protein